MNSLRDRVNFRCKEELELVSKKLEREEKTYEEIRKELEVIKNYLKELDSKKDIYIYEAVSKLNTHFEDFVRRINPKLSGKIIVNPQREELSFAILKDKKPVSLNLLSGGEKATVTIAFLLSFMAIRNIGFLVLDEIDAPLDTLASERFARLIKDLSKRVQFIIVTHNQMVMKEGDHVFGFRMVNGKTKVYSMK